MSDAFQHVLNARQRVMGNDETVNIGGTDYRALVETISSELVMLAGGRADAGGFRCQVAQQDLPDAPAIYTPISIRGHNFKIVPVDDVNAVAWIFIAIDPVAESA
jgi:hypothetical protein